MSNPLYRKFTIRRSTDEHLVIPRAQLLGMRWHRNEKGQESIEFRLSVGRVTLFGEQFDDLWVQLVNGELDTVDFNTPLNQGKLTRLDSDLPWSFSEPAVKRTSRLVA